MTTPVAHVPRPTEYLSERQTLEEDQKPGEPEPSIIQYRWVDTTTTTQGYDAEWIDLYPVCGLAPSPVRNLGKPFKGKSPISQLLFIKKQWEQMKRELIEQGCVADLFTRWDLDFRFRPPTEQETKRARQLYESCCCNSSFTHSRFNKWTD